MKRQVFISVLGYGNYCSCKYTRRFTGINHDKLTFVSSETRYVQTASIEYIYQNNCWDKSKQLKCLLLMDNDCYSANWVSHQIRRYEPKEIDQPGLKDCLDVLKKDGYNLDIEIIPIPAASTELDLWEIFRKTFEALEDQDTLYFDVTHSFRSHPILVMVLNNYAKLLLNVKVKDICYGNYEIRDTKSNIAPLIDLTPLNELQDWTIAASTFLETGHIEPLQQMAINSLHLIDSTHCSNFDRNNIKRMGEVISLLDCMVDERLFCRGRELTEAKTIQKLYDQIREDVDFGERMPVFQPIFDHIRESLAGFDSNENAMNGFIAAIWCFEKKQYQQCITLLEESLISVVCQLSSQKGLHMSYDKYSNRKLASTALYIYKNPQIPRNRWDVGEGTESQKEKSRRVVDQLLNLDIVQDLSDIFNSIREIRNDFNHAGILPNAKPSDVLREEIKALLNECEDILFDDYGL